jgi:hypothetical protein
MCELCFGDGRQEMGRRGGARSRVIVPSSLALSLYFIGSRALLVVATVELERWSPASSLCVRGI